MIDLELLERLVDEALAKETPETLDAFLSEYSDYVPMAVRNVEGFTGKSTQDCLEIVSETFENVLSNNQQTYTYGQGLDSGDYSYAMAA